MNYFYNILLCFIFVCQLSAQTDQRNYDVELRSQNEAINALKDEIEHLRGKIKKAE